MHPHHNFIICAFALEGTLTHTNTLGGLDELSAGDYYAFSAGSGGLHEELNRHAEPMRAIYLWLLPDHLLLPPTYMRGRFDAAAGMNQITALIGDGPGAVPIPQNVRVSRMVANEPGELRYRPRSAAHGVYAFVVDGTVSIDGTQLKRRDSKGIWETDEIVCRPGRGDTEVRTPLPRHRWTQQLVQGLCHLRILPASVGVGHRGEGQRGPSRHQRVGTRPALLTRGAGAQDRAMDSIAAAGTRLTSRSSRHPRTAGRR